MNSDIGHNEAQFQWLTYQLYSRLKLLPTLVAKWLERWQTCCASLRTEFMFGHKLKSDHGWIAVCTNKWCYKYIHMQIPVLVVGQTRSKFWLAPTPGRTPTGTMLPCQSTDMATLRPTRPRGTVGEKQHCPFTPILPNIRLQFFLDLIYHDKNKPF